MPEVTPGDADLGGRAFTDLAQVAEEVGASFIGVEGGTLVFSVKRTDKNEEWLREIFKTLYQLIITSPELKSVLDEYPKIVLR